MNFADLQEQVWNYDASSVRQDLKRQTIKDHLNACLDEIAGTKVPFLYTLMDESVGLQSSGGVVNPSAGGSFSVLSLQAGVGSYFLDDYCSRLLEIWTVDQTAHKVIFTLAKTADRDGSRITTLTGFGSFGPWKCTWNPRRVRAAYSGVKATVAEGDTVISSSTHEFDALAALTLTGKMLRLNGEDGDYKIVSLGTVAGHTVITVDRPVKARLAGHGITGLGAGYTDARWEISPPGALCIQFLPAPTSPKLVYYRGMRRPRRMIEDSDTPELPPELHHLLWKGALRLIGGFNEDDPTYERYTKEYAAGLEWLKKNDADDAPIEDAPFYLGGTGAQWNRMGILPGTDFRYGRPGRNY